MNNKIKAALILLGAVLAIPTTILVLAILPDWFTSTVLIGLMVLCVPLALYFWWRQLVDIMEEDKKYKSKKPGY
jgi:hypothetical protein